ncbi:TadE/TadG family type IV pilus assembly protein [Vibrio artabrorum]|uniref:Pilus assembly protein n=1 Tax=Vibrio artabrorum TaxID=446374 RepID=A0ABT8CDB3_9VIBR|nr:TadE/TadG family type IV pilus assembly protein [Vibrio artabrorum]MDN3699711.1 pilus assembly protein [Vibrio artabrorum]MDN3701814.1 pilus assembly protein [Vibrio artabrorum]
MRIPRYQYSSSSLQKQKGVAAVWMGLLLVPIMGVTFWAVEGTRYVQETSRLRDSAEAAALAVTIQDQPNTANSLAKKYVDNYVRDIKSKKLSAVRVHQAEDEGAGVLEYIQYTVNAQTTHDSWFVSSFIPSFEAQQTLAGRSLARKYPVYLGDNNIDIVFVSDFSGSMKDRWGQHRHRKIDDLKTAINRISDKILCSSTRRQLVNGHWKEVCDEPGPQSASDKLLNRVGFVPYNVRTREVAPGNQVHVTSQLSYKNNYRTYTSSYSYNDVDWNAWRGKTRQQVNSCARWQSYCYNPRAENHEYAKRVKDVLDSSRSNVADVYNYVDIPSTVNTMLTDKSLLKSNYYSVTGVNLFNGFGDQDVSQFHNIRLTNKRTDLNPISTMWANGGTNAYQGILRGSQILNEGNPHSSVQEDQQAYNKKIKMLLILSDGQESPNNNILRQLVSSGMCNKARQEIPGLYIGIIGINFRASQQSGFQDCVIDSQEDIIDVSNLDELIEKIEKLIRKGSKTSGITKLY